MTSFCPVISEGWLDQTSHANKGNRKPDIEIQQLSTKDTKHHSRREQTVWRRF